MKIIKASESLLLGILLAASFAAAQTNIKRVPAKPTVAVDGKTLYHEYCAVCHGIDGKGNGPAAAALKQPPSDLTQISRRNNGRFDDERMLRILNGQEGVTAHGSPDMPTWGAVFNNMASNPGLKQNRMHALTQYLEELQAR